VILIVITLDKEKKQLKLNFTRVSKVN